MPKDNSPESESTEIATVSDAQLAKAKNLNMTWEFEGQTFPFFVANATGNIGTPIIRPGTNQQIAILGADLMWNESQPFLDHLNLKIRDERSAREDESVRKRANIVRLNSELFTALVQGGSLIKVDEFGEHSEPIEKDRKAMLAYAPEIHSQVIDDWLGNFHVERYFPPGTDDVDAMMTNADTVFFKAMIGNYRNPAHVLIFEFTAPSPDARRSFEDDTSFMSSKRDGDTLVETYNIKQKAKLAFAKKYFKSVEGAVLGPRGESEPDTKALTHIVESDVDSIKAFKSQFNPHWWIRMSNALADAYDFTGK